RRIAAGAYFEPEHREPLARVGEDGADAEARRRGHGLDVAALECVAMLGADRLAPLEGEDAAAEAGLLLPGADEVHLDAARLGVPPRLVAECAYVEFAPGRDEAREEVQVEARGHALLVVVGALEHARIFDAIEPEEEAAARADEAREATEEGLRLGAREIAERAARKKSDLAGVPPRRRRELERRGVVGDHTRHLEPRERGAERARRLDERGAADVDERER